MGSREEVRRGRRERKKKGKDGGKNEGERGRRKREGGREQTKKPICYGIASINWDIIIGIFKNLTSENHAATRNLKPCKTCKNIEPQNDKA